jgi:hypothetical protein
MDSNIADRLLRETNDFEGARPLVDVEGLSSAKLCRFLNALVARMAPGEQYLEIGTWKGRTLLSAAVGNRGRVCVACDRFRVWGRYTGWGHVARRALQDNIARYRGDCAEIRVFDMRSERFFARPRGVCQVGVYFYDGDHSFAGTRRGIALGAGLLARRAVVLVDDWKDPVVRAGALAGLGDAGLLPLWSRSLPATVGDHEGFWKGLGVFYVERAGG